MIYEIRESGKVAIRKNCLQQVLADLVANGVTEKELSRAKVQAVNALYMNAESNMTLMRLYGRCMLKSGTLYNVDEEIDAYTSLTVADVNAIAREIFAQKHASAYVGKQIDDCDAVSKIVINA
ncbi:MAG: insulinase family protein [Clostridia bacterium]|nr:insulinase family protein [Clostridia bacterium]